MTKQKNNQMNIIIAEYMNESAMLGRAYYEDDPKYTTEMSKLITKATRQINKYTKQPIIWKLF